MSSKKRIVIKIFGTVILIILLICLINVPTISSILKIKQMIYLERTDLEKKYLRSQVQKKILRDFEQVKPEKERFDNIFIPKNKELEFVTSIEEIATRHNLRQEVSINNAIDKNIIYTVVPLSLKLKGDFSNILKYIDDLNKITYYYNILSIITNNNSDGVETTLIGEIYVLKQ